jgi:arabinan endo-1,5-alpha-L-arabinosidase
MRFHSFLLAFLAFLSSATALCQTVDEVYYNPVVDRSLPDPTIIKASDGYFYLYATEDIRNVPIYRSKDLVNWKFMHTVFDDTSRPRFVSGGGIWAPDINYINGQYVLYYSMSTWGGEWACGIGVATGARPYSYFKDRGKLFISSEIGVQNSIDPFYYEEEDGSKYLFWGSFRGIYAIELSDDGLSVKEGAVKRQVAGTMTEATYIYKHDGYYYLFGSAGSCCEGLRSTYRLVVARSKNLMGPYVDKNGKAAMNNNFSEVLRGSSTTVGPGHCSEIVEDDAGQTWIMYHGYMTSDVDNGRCLFLDQVQWDSRGWPYIVGERTSEGWDVPVIGSKNYTYSDIDYVEYKGESDNYRFMFDTGYVPTKNTKVEVDCYSYAENEDGEPATGKWRAVFSGRNSNADGISLYVNPTGSAWGYFVGGYKNDELTEHKYNTRYTVTARLADIDINGSLLKTNRVFYTSTNQRLTIFSGLQDYPYLGRIYGLKIYEANALVHDYKPMLRNEDEMVVFYDKVTDSYLKPSVPYVFTYGSIVDGITDVKSDRRNRPADGCLYNVQGQRVDGTYQGIIIRNGRKVLGR